MQCFEQPSLKRRIVKSAIWLFSTRYLAQGFTWVSTIIVARFLSPEDYGILGMAMIYISFMDSINELGFGAAIIQKHNLSQDELSGSFWMVLLISLGICGFTIVTAGYIADFFGNQELKNIIRVLSCCFVINGLRVVPYNLAAKELKFDIRSKAEIASEVLGAISVLLFALADFKVWSLVFGYLIRCGVLTSATQILMKWKVSFQFKFKTIKELISFGLTVTVSRLIWTFSSQTDYLIIAKIFGDVSLGYYTMAKNIASIPIEKFLSNLVQIIFPVFSISQNSNPALSGYFRKTNRVVAGLMFPALMGLAVIADDFIPMLLGLKWAPIVPFFKIFCIAGIASSLAIICGPMLYAVKKAKYEAKYQLIKALAMSLAFFIASVFGAVGVASVHITVYPILAWFLIKITIKEIDLNWREYLEDIKLPALKTIAMALIIIITNQIFLLRIESIPRLALDTSLGVMCYLALTIMLEKSELLGFFRMIIESVKKRAQ